MSTSAVPPAYEIKSADLPLVAFQLRTTDLEALGHALAAQLADTPDFFDQDPTLIDLDGLGPQADTVDLAGLQQLLRQHGLRPVAVRGPAGSARQATQGAGLAWADDARIRRQPPAAPSPEATVTAASAPPSAPLPAAAPLEALVVDRPLRSGQQVYAKGRDLIVLAMVNPGAEVLADGHIHVYAPLRGKAIAGARGFAGARIFAQNMDPELISIAGVYRTSDHPLPPEVRGRPAHVSLQPGADGDRLVIVPLQG